MLSIVAVAVVQGPSASAYVTYCVNNDALRAIQSVNNIMLDGRLIKTSLGTTKYCSHFMKNQSCPKPDCMYLHELGDSEASFTKEEMHQGKHQEYEKRLHDALIALTAANNLTSNGTGKLGETNKTNLPENGADVEPGKDAWPCLSTSPVTTNKENQKPAKSSASSAAATTAAMTVPSTASSSSSSSSSVSSASSVTTKNNTKPDTPAKENGKKKKDSKSKKSVANGNANQNGSNSSSNNSNNISNTSNNKDTSHATTNGTASSSSSSSTPSSNSSNNIKDQGFNTNDKDTNNKDRLDLTKPTMSADEELNLIQEIEKEADALAAKELDSKADTPSSRYVIQQHSIL